MEDLTEEQFESLAAQLRQLADELPGVIARAGESAATVELDQAAIGRLTRMDAMQSQAMARSSRRNLEQRLEQVKAALSAVEAGDYGECRRCEEPIGYARLQAVPEALLCLPCQGRSEGA